MKRTIRILGVILLLVWLVSCDAPGVILLDSMLPPVVDSKTGYTVTESVSVTNLDTGETVTLDAPTEVDAFHQRFEGIKCIKSREREEALREQYAVAFHTASETVTVIVSAKDAFSVGGIRYEALTAGVDMLYLASLFAGE